MPGTKIKTVKKYVVPDTKAATYWLNNRKPNDWKNSQEIKTDLNFENLSDDQLDLLFSKVMEGIKGNSNE